MRSVYPSDISRERFEIILPDLESCRKKTKPRKLDLYELFCGVLYVLIPIPAIQATNRQ